MLRVADHFAKSDTGRQRRANEDSFYARAPLFVVADGMGGAQAGEVASRMAVELFARGLPDGDGVPAERRLADRIEEANAAIHEHSREDAARAGMGTTITAAYVDADDVAIAHVGDSRAYLLRGGALERLTEDHSLVEELMRQGKLTAEEAGDHPQRSIITRALGPEPDVRVDTRTLTARDDDVLLLCSDGLTSMVDERRIEEILAGAGGLEQAGQELVAAANDAGGRDNITVVLIRLEEVARGARPAHEQPTSALDALGGSAAEAAAGPATAVATAEPPVRRQPVARRPHPRGAVPPPRRRGRRRLPTPVKAVVTVLVVLIPVVVGFWYASQSVYFVGTDAQGRITLYRGVPWSLPGIDLYTTEHVTGVPALEIPAAQRRHVLDHSLLSHDKAVSLTRQVELGQLQGMR